MDALQQALENRKVPHIDLTSFFLAEDNHKNQKIILDELEEYGQQYDEDGTRKSDHLIVGFISYPEFCARFKIVKQTAIFRKFSNVISGIFESIVFAELHWKLDCMK